MWRRFAQKCLLAAVFGLLSACMNEPGQLLQLPDARMQIEVPSGWQLQRVRGETLLFTRPVRDGVAVPGAYVMLLRHPQRDPLNGATLASYVEHSEQQARRYALRYASDAQPARKIAGQQAQSRLRVWQGHTREKRELALIWLQDGYGYELKAVAPPREFERLRAGFDRVAASLAPL